MRRSLLLAFAVGLSVAALAPAAHADPLSDLLTWLGLGSDPSDPGPQPDGVGDGTGVAD